MKIDINDEEKLKELFAKDPQNRELFNVFFEKLGMSMIKEFFKIKETKALMSLKEIATTPSLDQEVRRVKRVIFCFVLQNLMINMCEGDKKEVEKLYADMRQTMDSALTNSSLWER